MFRHTPSELPSAMPENAPLPFDAEHSVRPVKMGARVIAASDLHLLIYGRELHAGDKEGFFENAYTDREIVEHLKECARNADHLVLNGDIFELIYYHHRSKEEARNEAIEILGEIIEVCKQSGCYLHYVDGNHDDGKQFTKRLQKLQGEHLEHFSFHPVMLRLGPLLFTHGDLALRAGHDDITMTERVPSREKLITEQILKKHIDGDILHGFPEVRPVGAHEPFLQRMKRQIETHGGAFGGRKLVEGVEKFVARMREHAPNDPDQESKLRHFIRIREASLNANLVQRNLQKWEDFALPNIAYAKRLSEELRKADAALGGQLLGEVERNGIIIPQVRYVTVGHDHKRFNCLLYQNIYYSDTGSPLPGKKSGKYNLLLHTVHDRHATVESLAVQMGRDGDMQLMKSGRALGR